MKLIPTLLFLCMIATVLAPASAEKIEIFYPNPNITTDIYYATGGDYIHIRNNSVNVSEDFTGVVLVDQYVAPDIISEPVKILDYVPVLLFIIVLLSLIIFLVYSAKRLFR